MKEQIEEMAHILCDACREETSSVVCAMDLCFSCKEDAKALYNAGYRKQREGRWTYGVDREGTMKCTLCRRRMPKIDGARYCPNCGAKMKGGE